MTGVVREKAGLRVKRERRLTLLNKHVLLDRSHYYTKKCKHWILYNMYPFL